MALSADGTSGEHHILSVLVENKFGVLTRVAGLFARRGFNIVSLAVSPTEDERYSEVYLSPDLPDYVKWAEAMGCVGFRVDTPEDVQPTIEKANSIDDRPVVIDFRTDYREKVYPMVAPGTTNDEIILDPAHDKRGGR